MGCHSAVRDAWHHNPHGNPMQYFMHLLSHVRFHLSNWRRLGVKNLEASILDTEANICRLEELDHSVNSHTLLMEQYAKLTTLQCQCCFKWAQLSHLDWVMDGDRNTHFFHATTRTRSLHNITQLTDLQGNLHSDQVSIENVFLNFYKDLWSSGTAPLASTCDITNSLPNDLPRLFDAEATLLIQEVTIEEVYDTISDLPIGKSLGPDGFNVEFYRIFWPVIRVPLFSAIRFFFTHSIIPNSWAKSYIILVLKKDKPKLVSDFCPIFSPMFVSKSLPKFLLIILSLYSLI